MGAFNSAIITKKGQALLAKTVGGDTKLEFTQIKTSENVLSGDLASRTHIGTVKQAEKVASIVRQNDYNVKVSTSFSNNGLTAGYYIRNIGLYATDPTEGEILYSISVADESTATADWMPPSNGVSVSSLMVDLITAVSNASSVNITVDPTATATVAQIIEVHNRLTALDNSVTTTTEKTLKGSVAGGLKINKVLGRCEQEAPPTPDAPQEIKSVEVGEIRSHRKNCVRNTATTQTYDGVTFTVNPVDGSVTANGTAKNTVYFSIGKVIYRKGKQYRVSGCPTGGSDTGYFLQANYRTVTNDPASIRDTGLGKVYTSPVNSTDSVFICVMQGTTVNNITFYPMVMEVGTGNDTYEPYTETSATLSSAVILNGVDGIGDMIVEKDGVYGVEKRFLSYTLTGNETFRIGSEGAYAWIQFNSWFNEFVIKNSSKVLCNRFKYEDWDTSTRASGVVTVDTNPWLRFYCDEFTSLEAVKQFFIDNETSIIYELAEPIFEPLPTADQIALRSLVSYDEITHLATNSAVDPVIEVEYGTTKVGAYTLAGMLIAQRIDLKLNQA